LTKILGYDYEIIYKKGKYNIVVDELSHQHEGYGSLFALSLSVPDWIEEVPRVENTPDSLQVNSMPSGGP
jgi:hypothetical protein